MTTYRERTYRERVRARGLVSFNVVIKETDIWLSAGKRLEKDPPGGTMNIKPGDRF